MALGLDFGPAFTATFGLPPDGLFGLYSHYVGSASSKWLSLFSDTVIWSLIGFLAVLAMFTAWRRHPLFEGEPMDLEAIAAAGEEALRSGVLWMPPQASREISVPTENEHEPDTDPTPTIH